MARLSHSQRVRIFGEPCQAAYRRSVETPWAITVVCHVALVERFLFACHLAATRSTWRPRRIDSYNCRKIRGSNAYSLHSWPLAWDFFDRPLPEPVDVWGRTNAPDAAFRQAFADAGFHLGADFSGRKDYPHIEWADDAPGPLSQPQTSQEDDMPKRCAVNDPKAPGDPIGGRDGHWQVEYGTGNIRAVNGAPSLNAHDWGEFVNFRDASGLEVIDAYYDEATDKLVYAFDDLVQDGGNYYSATFAFRLQAR